MKAVAALAAAALLTSGAVAASAAPSQSPSSYPSCGVHRAQSNPLLVLHRQAFCLLEARRTRKKARAAVVSTTIEGDPIVTYYFVNGRRPVLVVVDATRDDFGPRVWLQRRCDRMRLDDGSLVLERCTPLGRGKPTWLRPIRL